MWVTTGARRSGITTTSMPLARLKCSIFGPVEAGAPVVCGVNEEGVATAGGRRAMKFPAGFETVERAI
jgi:hypothetical protein